MVASARSWQEKCGAETLRLAGWCRDGNSAERCREAGLLLLLGLLIGIAFLNSPGTSDRGRWLLYMGLAHERGITETYHIAAIDGVGDQPTDRQTDYPPLGIVALWLLARFAHPLGLSDFDALKLSLVLFTLGCAGMVAVWQGKWRPHLGIAAFLVLALGALLQAYIDVYFAFVLLVAFYCLERGRLATGTMLFALACLIKWQPIILAPLVLLYVIPRSPRPLHLARLVPAAFVVLATYLVFGNDVVVAFITGTADARLSGLALNFNWILTGLAERHQPGYENGLVRTLWFGRTPLLESGLYLNLALLSTALRYLCFAVSVVYFYFSQRTFAEFLRAAIVCFMAYFTFGGGVHENHAFLPALLGLCWLAMDRTRTLEAALLAVMFNLNLFLFYGANGVGAPFSTVVAGWDMTIFLAAFNVVVFAILWLPLAVSLGQRLARAMSPDSTLRRRSSLKGAGVPD
jgi:uncharacterized membrane protein